MSGRVGRRERIILSNSRQKEKFPIKETSYKRIITRITINLSAETNAGRQWNGIFKMMRKTLEL